MNDKSGLSRTLYDNKGNLIVSTSNNDKDIVRYEYDTNDRITKTIYPTNATVTYTYDENGNIKTVTDKDGLKTTYTYDENDNEVLRTTGLIETNKRYDADNRLIRIKNEHRFTGELIDEYSYRYDSNNNIIEEIKREPYRKKVSLLDIEVAPETNSNIRVTKQNFTYDAENKLTDARVERLGMKALSEPNVTTYHYEYDANGNRTTVEIKDDGLTLESTVYTYDRLNKLVSSREVTASGLYLYEYTYDDNGNLIKEDRHRIYEINTNQWTNIRRYEYTKDNKLESVYSGNILLAAYTYDGDGLITSTLDRDLDLNQNLNIHDHNYINSLTNNQRQLINKVPTNDSFLYELTEYVTDKNQTYTQTLMERDGTGQLSTIYTYGSQRINSESYNNLSGLYTYDGRGSVSAVIGSYGDFRASYWYDGLGNVKSQIHGYGAFGSGKKYYGYNAEQYNPVTGNQNLRNRQLNIRRQRFFTEDTYIGNKRDIYSLNRYLYANNNPLIYKDPDGNFIIILSALAIAAVVATVGAGVGVGVYNGVKTGDWEYGLKTGLVAAGTVGTAMATGTAILTGGATTPIAVGMVKATAAVAASTYVGSVVHGESENLLLNTNHSQTEIFGNATKNSISSIPMTVTVMALPTKEGVSLAAGVYNATSYAYDNLFTNNKHSIYDTINDSLSLTATTYTTLSFVEAAMPYASGLYNGIKGAVANSRLSGCEKAPVDYSGSDYNLHNLNYKTFNNKEALRNHFQKHGHEIANVLNKTNYTMSDYLSDANYIINNGEYSSDLNGMFHL
ncbi:MAG: hypothetical protein J6M39_08930 [Lachnospiraceae bacterium]|nr:hypothetical protein [Lachnospiraceae bacterium]